MTTACTEGRRSPAALNLRPTAPANPPKSVLRPSSDCLRLFRVGGSVFLRRTALFCASEAGSQEHRHGSAQAPLPCSQEHRLVQAPFPCSQRDIAFPPTLRCFSYSSSLTLPITPLELDPLTCLPITFPLIITPPLSYPFIGELLSPSLPPFPLSLVLSFSLLLLFGPASPSRG